MEWDHAPPEVVAPRATLDARKPLLVSKPRLATASSAKLNQAAPERYRIRTRAAGGTGQS
jgi:hypothetical protein